MTENNPLTIDFDQYSSILVVVNNQKFLINKDSVVQLMSYMGKLEE